MKKALALILCLILVVVPCVSVLASAEEDAGYTTDTENKTFTVTTPAGLKAVVEQINGAFETYGSYNVTLAADLDFTTIEGRNWKPIASNGTDTYTGTFDGAGHTIKGMVTEAVATSGTRYQALIGVSGEGCVVKNLTVADSVFEGREYVAAIIGLAKGTVTVQNVHVKNATINGRPTDGNNVGGICGRFTNGTSTENINFLIENCTVQANMSSFRNVGGICGGEALSGDKAFTVVFRNCVTAGEYVTIKTDGSGNGTSGIWSYNGGGAEDQMNVTFENCISIAKLTAGTTTELGAMTYRMFNGVYTFKNCYGVGGFASVLNAENIKHTATVENCAICDPEKLADGGTASFWAEGITVNEPTDAKMTIDKAEVKFAEATLPVISAETLKTRAAALFASDEAFKAIVLDLLSSIGHTHKFDQQVTTDAYLKTKATCQNKAVYYYSCTCGLKGEETFEYGDFANHDFAPGWSMDEEGHWHICVDCRTEKADEGAHTFGEWTVKREATEKREGERVHSCTVCGYEESEKIAKLTPATTEPATEEQKTAKKKGCGSTITGGIGMILAVVAVGGFAARKKKED